MYDEVHSLFPLFSFLSPLSLPWDIVYNVTDHPVLDILQYQDGLLGTVRYECLGSRYGVRSKVRGTLMFQSYLVPERDYVTLALLSSLSPAASLHVWFFHHLSS